MRQDGKYRFTELPPELHCEFTRRQHTASRQRFGAGRGQGEKSRSGNRLDADRCRLSFHPQDTAPGRPRNRSAGARRKLRAHPAPAGAL